MKEDSPLLPREKKSNYLKEFLVLTNLALNYGGIFVFLAALIDPENLSKHACPSPEENYWKDWGKIIFIAGFMFRFLAVPPVEKVAKKLLKEKMPSDELINLVEAEVVDSLETELFVITLFLQSMKNAKAASVLAVFGLWPTISLIIHAFDPSFSRGVAADYHNHYPQNRIKKIIIILLESFYNGLSLSSALSVLEPLIVNVFYDSTHSESMPDQPFILNGMMLAGLLFGLTSVLHPKLLRMMRFLEGGTNSFYYAFMFIISSFFCLTPKSMNDEGFKTYGWMIALGFGLISLFLAFDAAKDNQEFGYKDHYIKNRVVTFKRYSINYDPEDRTPSHGFN